MKIKLNESEWKKFEMIDDEFFTEVYAYDAMRKILKPPCLIKLKNNNIMSIGDINTLFGECDCCRSIDFEDIKEYVNIEIEE